MRVFSSSFTGLGPDASSDKSPTSGELEAALGKNAAGFDKHKREPLLTLGWF